MNYRKKYPAIPAVLGMAIVAGICSFTQPVTAAKMFETAPHPEFVPGEVLVKFRDDPDIAYAQESLMHDLAARARKMIGNTGISLMQLDKDADIKTIIQQMKSDPRVEYVEPNYIYHATATTPNDPLFDPPANPYQWGFAKIDAESAWDYQTDCSSVTVAVLDTGINYDHADLKASMITDPMAPPPGYMDTPKYGWDFIDDDGDPIPDGGTTHGTHVAGTIGAIGNNGIGVAGVCWQAKIMAVRVLGPDGSGPISDIIDGIDWAIDNGAEVINMSLGGSGYSSSFEAAIDRAEAAGIITVVAAGNSGTNNDVTPFYPCNFGSENIICVASLDSNDELSSWSNYGAVSVDVGEPGSNIISTWPGGILGTNLGTWTEGHTSGSHWARQSSCDFGSGPYDMLVIPDTWCSSNANYLDATDTTIWGAFNLSGLLGAGLNYAAFIDTEQNGDFFEVWASTSGGNPRTSGIRSTRTSGSTLPYAYYYNSGLHNCLSANCTAGFHLDTDNDSTTGTGIGILNISVQKVEANANEYDVISGTSMATPHVSGIAALVLAWNDDPGYTPAHAIEAILTGGENLPALAGKTVTGKAANAMGALSHLTVPTGVTAAELP